MVRCLLEIWCHFGDLAFNYFSFSIEYLKFISVHWSPVPVLCSDTGPVSNNRIDQMRALEWIQAHLEECHETCLPKQQVYNEYK